MTDHVFTGFGFGPIQAGLFAKEAFQSGNFSRIVVAEIDRALVKAVRDNNASYSVNIAGPDGIEAQRIENVELLDPADLSGRKTLLEVLARSTEIVTSLPSVDFYDAGGDSSVAALIAGPLSDMDAPGTLVYAAENNNRAAQLLNSAIQRAGANIDRANVQFLNTVIGKMSRVVTDPEEIAELNLEAIAPGIERAFLVEQFNKILVTRTRIQGIRPGIEVFIEKDDLLPFEEAKLFGHNAVHSLLGFLGMLKGYTAMTRIKEDRAIMKIARDSFIDECGAALIAKYGNLGDSLFTGPGFAEYAGDLLERMTNPFLADTCRRAARDVVRKLGPEDRIFGTMRLAIEQGIEPKNMAVAALAGITLLIRQAEQYSLPTDLHFENAPDLKSEHMRKILTWLWKKGVSGCGERILATVCAAKGSLISLLAP
ncbi:MAG: hypothetical protein JW720_05810 [Sedimentisphaerales bacterium]|nr:hypothetical protein [Sedimentisphaerales bacterium]